MRCLPVLSVSADVKWQSIGILNSLVLLVGLIGVAFGQEYIIASGRKRNLYVYCNVVWLKCYDTSLVQLATRFVKANAKVATS